MLKAYISRELSFALLGRRSRIKGTYFASFAGYPTSSSRAIPSLRRLYLKLLHAFPFDFDPEFVALGRFRHIREEGKKQPGACVPSDTRCPPPEAALSSLGSQSCKWGPDEMRVRGRQSFECRHQITRIRAGVSVIQRVETRSLE
jgi:hypothetical protein